MYLRTKVQMYLPSPRAGRVPKSGLFLQGALSSLYPDGEEKGACSPLLLFITDRNGPGIFPRVAQSSPGRGELISYSLSGGKLANRLCLASLKEAKPPDV